MKKILFSFLIIFPFILSAQDKCGVVMNDKQLQAKYSSWNQRKANFEAQIQAIQAQRKNSSARVEDKIYTIPVVVHILHNNVNNIIGGANNINIADAQIKSQIQILNEDYRRQLGTNGYNLNPLGADMEINFKLADVDPDGNATTGITRTYVKQTGFNFVDDKNQIAEIIQWDNEKYLNIWVTRGNNGVIGYASFPYDSKIEGLGANSSNIAEQELFDGVIIDYRNFGNCCGTLSQTYNLGRTTTHEVGHWLGLLHPNGDENCGTDYCDDTPQIESLNLNTTCDRLTSNCGSERITNMIENYMDYSPDRCMNVFTLDQKNRTRAALSLSVKRQVLLNNAEPLSNTEQLQVSVEPNPINSSTDGSIKMRVTFKDEQDLIIQLYDGRGILIQEKNLIKQKSGFFYLSSESLATGYYILNIKTNTENISKKVLVQR
ncbi:M43 family zinc metalloprotease [Arcicella rosea]|uniref:Peptidase M43 pregnancy-associated plasma-A domain-containing protein n=1 Tax=Arcicella rosea TaxID=502909 RepID=A0A841EQX5_9BACT|nr:M43 family zinc metalloprotease [Arcicella rosea]MBB6005675.1 hypothetical protein [Arcicella rosea]